MTPFEQHMRKYHPASSVARLSVELDRLRGIVCRISAATYGSEAYPISEEDEKAMADVAKEHSR